MPRRPTLQDLAQAAGVGTATVDRALNGRGNVSTRTVRLISDAARQIGYPLPDRLAPARETAIPRLDLSFVLHKPSQAFYQTFAQDIARACADVTDAAVTPHLSFSPSQAPDDFAQALSEAARKGQAVAATAINHPTL